MSSIPARMKKIQLKMKALECSQDFSHYKSMGNFKLVRGVMDVLVTCKNEDDPIKNEGARVVTTLYSNFSDVQGQITLVLVSVSGRNLNSSKLSCMSSLPRWSDLAEFQLRQDVMDVLVTCKYEEDPIKMKVLEWTQHFPNYNLMGAIRCHGHQSCDLIWP